jgi:Sensors of blue-light using FAD
MFDEFGFPADADSAYAGPILDTFVYCSRAAEGVDDAEVDRIIDLSQRNNAVRDITGVLRPVSP